MAFDVVQYYHDLREREDDMPTQVAAIETLAALMESSTLTTTTELLELIKDASSELEKASWNPVSVAAGTALFLRFLTLQRPAPGQDLLNFKDDVVFQAREFVRSSSLCRDSIAENMSQFVHHDMTILVHGYSRVVVQSVLHCVKTYGKRLRVYCTEARPYGLGIKMYQELTAAEVECQVILDSAVAYIMSKVDLCMIGAEAVCASGGLVNFIGTSQMAIAAKALNKPIYALAESFKFSRIFPLSQYDLPSNTTHAPLSFDSFQPESVAASRIPQTALKSGTHPEPLQMTKAMVENNPTSDYTPPDLVTLIVSDLGPMTPSGISDVLLSIYGGE